MRRQDREVTDPNAIERIIAAGKCIRLGFYDGKQVYIVPLSFGFVVQDGRYTFYFHSAKEGRKIDLIRQSPAVGFEMDVNYKLNAAETACGYSAGFQSVIGNGVVSFVEDPEEKKAGLRALMKQQTGRGDWDFSQEQLCAVCVFKMTVEQLSCKEHR